MRLASTMAFLLAVTSFGSSVYADPDDSDEPHWMFDMGVVYRRLGAVGPTDTARVLTPVAPPAVQQRDALAYVHRAALELPHGLYGAVEGEVGNLVGIDSDQPSNPKTMLAGFLAAGYRLRLGALGAGAELATGAVFSPSTASTSGLASAGEVEARGYLALQLNRFYALAAVAGTSLVRGDAWMMGLAFEVRVPGD
ncbi:MAG TPA: hypothetical protein VMJ10_04775 [Kofleriaceae bacterium]|nr:hypothetical protein [Kofleriaceae bacterium]